MPKKLNTLLPPVAIPVRAAYKANYRRIAQGICRDVLSPISFIFQDAKINSPKIKCFLVLFRIASLVERKKKNLFCRALYYLANTIYCLYSDLFVGGAELPAGTKVGRNLTIHHGYGIVVGKGVCINNDVILRQGVTIGNYVDRSGRLIGDPIVEAGVEFGAGACAFGNLTIGEGAFVGANCVVFKDVLAGDRVYPGRATVRSQVHEREDTVFV